VDCEALLVEDRGCAVRPGRRRVARRWKPHRIGSAARLHL